LAAVEVARDVQSVVGPEEPNALGMQPDAVASLVVCQELTVITTSTLRAHAREGLILLLNRYAATMPI
jgi:hypothetical protein